jgi:hypothetical protein
MDRSFWMGLGAGVTTTVVVLTGTVLLSGVRGATEVKAGQVTSVRTGPRAVPAQDLADSLSEAEDGLARSHAELEKGRAKLEASAARVSQLENFLGDLGRENADLKAKVDRALKTDDAARAQAQEEKAKADLSRLRSGLRIGGGLSDETTRWLGLDAGQRQVVENLLQQEGSRMYGVLRALAAEDTSIVVPSDDGPELFLALASSSAFMAEIKKFSGSLASDPDLQSGKKTLYLEDQMSPTSPVLRLCDALQAVRQETLQSGRTLLSEAQAARFSELLGAQQYNFGGAVVELPPNVLARRPR